MQRHKAPANGPSPPASGWWLAGAVIGGTIVTIAIGAMALGTGAALQIAVNGARRPGG